MKRFSLVLAATLAVPAAHALPLLSIYGGAYSIQSETSGKVAAGAANIDLEDDLGFGDRASQQVLFVGLEHAVPLVPNARLRWMSLSDNASTTLDNSVTFKDTTFAEGTQLRSSVDMDMVDATAYYSFLSNPISLNVGLSLRQLDAEVSLRDADTRSRERGSAVFPLGHARVGVQFPFTGFYGDAEVNAISFDGSRISDVTARLGWRSEYLLGVELGYSDVRVKLDDVGGLDTDLTMSGPFIGLSLQF